MKKTLIAALALTVLSTPALADSYSHRYAVRETCKMAATLAFSLAESKQTGKPPLATVDQFKDGDQGLYALMQNMERIANENEGIDAMEVGRRALMWCMDNGEYVIRANR